MIVVISTGESAADARQVLRDMAAGDVELVAGRTHVGVEIIGTVDESDWIADVRWSVTGLAAAAADPQARSEP